MFSGDDDTDSGCELSPFLSVTLRGENNEEEDDDEEGGKEEEGGDDDDGGDTRMQGKTMGKLTGFSSGILAASI